MSCIEKRDRMLFQYKSTPNYNALWDGTFDFIDETSSCSLYNFFDLSSAEGLWLDYLGLIFNQGRTFPTLGSVLTWDSGDVWDDTDIWDGTKQPLNDISYRALIWARIARNNTRGTINDVVGVLQTALNVDNVIIVEGIKHLDITIDFSDANSLEIFNALSALDSNWFGVPAGVSFTITKVL